jgi:hypothetical protein
MTFLDDSYLSLSYDYLPRISELSQNTSSSQFLYKTDSCEFSFSRIVFLFRVSNPDRAFNFISYILTFFAASDGVVNKNLVEHFYQEVQIPKARAFYSFQIMMENVHSETYSLLINTIIKDGDDCDCLLKSLDTIFCIQAKATWALRWIHQSDISFALHLIVFAAVEGIFSS